MPRALRPIFRNFALPAALYALIYYLFSFPLWHSFSTHYFCGQEDGYQNIWNLWWMNKAVTELHQSPWYTTWLHYPAGTSLIAHTLAPFNGFLAILFLKLGMSLNQAYNTIVIFSFVMTGVSTFWLAFRVTNSYVGSLFAGAAFTFCHFHFAHAQNHLQMVSLEWLPLAVLAVYELLTGPTILKSIAAAAALFLVAMIDFHLTFYVVVAGTVLGVIVLVRLWRNEFVEARKYIAPLLIFVILVSASTGVLAFNLLKLNHADPLQQNHDPKVWSTDLIDPAIPSAQWRFNQLTKPVWSVLATPDKDFVYIEHSLYIGWVVLSLCVWVLIHRREAGLKDCAYWIGLLALFFVLSLGPWIHAGGKVTKIPGLYPVLEWIFPPLKMGGVPIRLMAMVFLTSAIIAAASIKHVMQHAGRWRWFALSTLILIWALESLPKAQPTTPATYPQWVKTLHDLPDGEVIDTTYQSNMSLHLYYATGHGKPVGEGYISRYPKSVEQKRGQFRKLVDNQDWNALANDWGFKYLVIDREVPDLKLLTREEEIRVYQLAQ